VSTADDRERPRTGVADELRALSLLALDRLDPLLARLREHPELIERYTDRAAGLLVVLRDALDERVDVPPPEAPRAEPTTSRVQRIPVERVPVAPTGNGAPC
jgi:hypothetical protein